jgi:hypothetical protein
MVTVIVIAVLAALVGVADFVRLRRRRGGDSVARLDAGRVPLHLRHLLPLVEKWGIGDDGLRNERIERADPAEKRELHDAFYGPYEQITEWLASFGKEALPAEAAAFMYAQLALDEMGYYILEEKQQRPRP